jgi:hypothetical protein
MIEPNKVFIEARHEMNLKLSECIENINAIVNLIKTEFPQLNMDLNNNMVNLTNPSNRINLLIDSNRIVVDCDIPIKMKKCHDLFQKVSEVVISNLKINYFRRIGLRAIWTEDADIKKIDEYIKKNFLKLTNDELGKFGTNDGHYHFGFTAHINENKVNYNIGTGSSQDIRIDNNGIKTSIRNFLIIDIDFYNDTGEEAKRIKSFIDEGIKEIEKKAIEYYKLIWRD